ncbi:MAG: hypothetical protein KDH96_03620 [Candidatus Riesia sp.]|nr:hypothetical protein [Candidatus Riesia sp.]
MIEQLEEGWVRFKRFHCKEGVLDCWQGDSINNPNNKMKNLLSLNSHATYWRVGNSKWVSELELGGKKILNLLPKRFELTAQEIWDELIQ